MTNRQELYPNRRDLTTEEINVLIAHIVGTMFLYESKKDHAKDTYRRLTGTLIEIRREDGTNGELEIGYDVLKSAEQAGFLRHTFLRHCYGHTDYYLTDKGYNWGLQLIASGRFDWIRRIGAIPANVRETIVSRI